MLTATFRAVERPRLSRRRRTKAAVSPVSSRFVTIRSLISSGSDACRSTRRTRGRKNQSLSPSASASATNAEPSEPIAMIHCVVSTASTRASAFTAARRLVTMTHAVEMYDALPNAELAVVPGTSHFLTQEKPHLVNELVLDFLTNDPVQKVAPIRRAQPPS
jgi:hypothetical protein